MVTIRSYSKYVLITIIHDPYYDQFVFTGGVLFSFSKTDDNMTYNTALTTESLVYPGGYVMLPETTKKLRNLRSGSNDTPSRLPVNINEFPDCYRIEAGIPVGSREEIMIDITESVLSIIVLRKIKTDENPGKDVLQIHEFSDEPLQRHIELPADANAEFISAELKNGILRLDIPRDYKQGNNNCGQVVVY